MKEKIQAETKEKEEYIKSYHDQYQPPERKDFNVKELENTSNLWSETITVSDEFSEIKPNMEYLQKLGVEYNPNEL